MKRGFVYDIFPLFAVVMFMAVAFGVGAYLTWKAEDILDDRLSKGDTIPISREEYKEVVTNPLTSLDFVVPLLVGIGSVTMIISGYTSQSPSTLIILFTLLGIIGITAIYYINQANTEFWGMLESKEGRLSYPYTAWTLQNLPMILGLTLILTGLFMHSKTQAAVYR